MLNNNNNNGSTYLYISIVLVGLFSILIVILNISINSTKVSKIYDLNADKYYIKEYGAKLALNKLNNYIINNKAKINNNILKELQKIDLSDKLIFINESTENIYEGKLYFKKDDNIYKKLYLENIENIIEEFFNSNKKISNNIFSYKIDTYFIRKKTPYKNLYYIESNISNEINNLNSDKLIAYLEYNLDINLDVFLTEKYVWNDKKHNIFGKGLSENININNLINSNIIDNNIDYSIDFPLFILKEGNKDIDISNFYNENFPNNNIIINNSEEDLFIYTTDLNKNEFCGIIISRGNIYFDEGTFNIIGDIISENNIILDDKTNLNINTDKNIILDLNIKDIKDRRKLYDILNLHKYLKILPQNLFIENDDIIKFDIINIVDHN